jgi:AhpD family alkylhydroperoxidase
MVTTTRIAARTPSSPGTGTHTGITPTTPSTARIPRTRITGLYGLLIKTFARRMLGTVPESVEVMWHHPAVLKDMMGFGQKVEKWRRLDPNLAALAAMAAAGRIGCNFCLDLNYFMAHTRGLDAARLREVLRWRASAAFTPLERRVMEYAEAMSETPPAVTDDQSAALLRDLGAPALIELTARVAFMNTSARANIALGIRSEGFSDSCGLPPLAPLAPRPTPPA